MDGDLCVKSMLMTRFAASFLRLMVLPLGKSSPQGRNLVRWKCFLTPPSRAHSIHYLARRIGDAAVGKSSIVERFVKNQFFEMKYATIGAAFLTQTMQLDDYTIKFEIWDTAGQERFRSLAPMYYRGASAALVVYDITDKGSFAGAKTIIEELQRQGSADIVIALAGNKLDLEDKREVWAAEARAYAQDNGCVFFETSAKTAENVQAVFQQIAEKLPKDRVAATNEYVQIIPPDSNESTPWCCLK